MEEDEWCLTCIAYITKILTRIGLVHIQSDDNKDEKAVVVPTGKRWVFRAKYRSTEADNSVVIHSFNQVCMRRVV